MDADLSHQSFTEVADDIGAEAQPDMGSTARAVLHLLANDHRLFRFVEAVTACPPLKVFDGRIYRMAAGTGHHDTWHDDFVKDRVVGMSVNLSRAAYGGGTFHIRAKGSESNGTAFPNKGYGDCIMFALGREFEHQVTAVTSGVKTAFAGWYRGAGGFLDNFQSG